MDGTHAVYRQVGEKMSPAVESFELAVEQPQLFSKLHKNKKQNNGQIQVFTGTVTDGPFLRANMLKCTFNPEKKNPYWYPSIKQVLTNFNRL